MALIELKKVSRHFMMGQELLKALDQVDCSVDQGEFVAIVGPSGSGKSTMMNILGILDQPTEGEYFLDGKSVKEMNDDDRALYRNQKIGFVFQSFYLLPRMTALRNVQLPLIYSASYDRQYSAAKIDQLSQEAMIAVGLGDRMSHRPNELSGGQRQRVAIARALVNKPKLILADEPTGNLDSKSGREILDLFRRLHQQGTTVVLVTHDPQIAKEVRRVVTFKDGKVQSDHAMD